MKSAFALASGLIFGLGLVISGMANPAKVQNFLDVFGTWDPSLAFVMGGAILVTAPGYKYVLKRPNPITATNFQIPSRTDLDPKLLTGSATFGVGWGLSGFCPGPAITSVSLLSPSTLLFVVFMIIGMWGAKMVTRSQTNDQGLSQA